MTNEHNPIAVRINHLQSEWMSTRKKQPHARLIRWLIDEPDLPLVNGFYKLESSPYGKMEELLVVMLSDFETSNTFSYHLAHDWILAYEKAIEQNPQLNWANFDALKTEFDTINHDDTAKANSFLVKLVEDFKESLSKNRTLFIGIVPRIVYNHGDLNQWASQFLSHLSDDIGLVFTDYKGKGYHDELFTDAKWKNKTSSINLKNQDILGAYKDLMTQGNPNDPQVTFRKCIMEMAESAAEQNKSGVYKWGQKALDVTQSTGDIAFWASAHLVFAGNLFYFRDSQKVFELLNRALELGKKRPDNLSLQTTLLQAYAFKASYFSVIGKHQEAVDAFKKQAQRAIELDQIIMAIGAYKNALIVAQQHHLTEEIKELTNSGFNIGYSLEDNILKSTEFGYIANIYVELFAKNPNIPQVQQRMLELYGKDWRKRNTIEIPGQKQEITN